MLGSDAARAERLHSPPLLSTPTAEARADALLQAFTGQSDAGAGRASERGDGATHMASSVLDRRMVVLSLLPSLMTTPTQKSHSGSPVAGMWRASYGTVASR